MKIAVDDADLRWVAQTIHNAYHVPPDSDRVWQFCEKSVCTFIQDTIRMQGGKLNNEEIPGGKE